MLVPNQQITIKWNVANKKHFISLGYVFTAIGDEFVVKPEDLTKGSQYRVKVQCDYCGTIIDKIYQSYLRGKQSGDKDCCYNCQKLKHRETLIDKYGVTNISQIEETKTKKKQKAQEKYGVDCVLQSADIKKQIRQTCLERYGVEAPMQSEMVKEKSRCTCLEKYGCENASQAQQCKDKAIQTNLEKYGVPYTLQDEAIRAKGRATLINRYGVAHILQNTEVLAKMANDNLEKYGYKWTCQIPEVRTKMTASLCANGNVKTSKLELTLHQMLVDIYGESNCIKNYPVDRIALDTLLMLNGNKIDVELDGWYWHRNKQEYDKRRNYFVIKQGYRVLRIKTNTQLPTREQLIEAIDYLVKDNHRYAEIVLDI